MEFLLLIEDRRDEAPRESVGVEEMGKFARELAAQGVLRGADGPLRAESEAARVRVKRGVPVVVDGPFAEGREVVGGYFVVDVADRAAAIELAKRSPYARAGVIEVRAVANGRRMEGSGAPRFVLLFLSGPELAGPGSRAVKPALEPGAPADCESSDDPRRAEMGAFHQVLAQEGKLIGGGRLPPETPAAHVEIRGAKTIVTDGPFAETKEIIAGFAVIQAADRVEAIEIAKRMPHAKWGVVVVREVAQPAR